MGVYLEVKILCLVNIGWLNSFLIEKLFKTFVSEKFCSLLPEGNNENIFW
jgi:hypothetical protein